MSRHVELYCLKGEIQISSPVVPGLLLLGMRELGTVDVRKERLVWEVRGTVILNGRTRIGGGSKISVGEGGKLVLGEGFAITGSSAILCSKHIEFGRDCLLSWDILIMDSDMHTIRNDSNVIINPSVPILIGDHVWIGCRSTLLKGVRIASHTVVAANSVLTKQIDIEHVILGGNNVVLKRNINWEK